MMNEKPHILIVEDDPDGIGFLAVLLGWEGYQISSATDLAQARELIDKTQFDLYLLDTWLPDGSGIDLCKQIKTKYQDSKVVFYSGLGYEKDKKLALESGAQAYIVKPGKPGEVESTLARCIRRDGHLNGTSAM